MAIGHVLLLRASIFTRWSFSGSRSPTAVSSSLFELHRYMVSDAMDMERLLSGINYHSLFLGGGQQSKYLGHLIFFILSEQPNDFTVFSILCVKVSIAKILILISSFCILSRLETLPLLHRQSFIPPRLHLPLFILSLFRSQDRGSPVLFFHPSYSYIYYDIIFNLTRP